MKNSLIHQTVEKCTQTSHGLCNTVSFLKELNSTCCEVELLVFYVFNNDIKGTNNLPKKKWNRQKKLRPV